MRAVIQRVLNARVEVNKRASGEIGKGLLIFLGVGDIDSEKDCEYLANKIINLRVFPDENDLMNLSLLDVHGAAMVVSQFTLLGDCRKGRRPSFAKAARPENARKLYEYFIGIIKQNGVDVSTGEFQEMMEIHLINDGPVTLLLDSRKEF